MGLIDERHLWLIGRKWRGPVFLSVGVFLLVSQVLAWWTMGILHSWLIGGGIGLILVGGVAWFLYLDDALYDRRRGMAKEDDQLPSADEYDALLDAAERERHGEF